jgi:hypothetical protein
MHRSLRHPMRAAVVGALAITLAATPVAGLPLPPGPIGPGIPGDGLLDPGTGDGVAATPPATTVFASCVRTSAAGLTVWFGYESTAVTSYDAPIGAGNMVFSTMPGASTNRGQITQFQSGRTERAWALTVPVGSTVTWQVSVALANTDPRAGQRTTVSASNSAATPTCVGSTPTRSAAPQVIDGVSAGLRVTPENLRRDSAGKLTSANVRFALDGVTSGCSDGGVPLDPVVVWGYGPPSGRDGALLFNQSPASFVPLPASAVLRVDQFTDEFGNVTTWERTRRSVRRVGAPQVITAFATTPAQSTYYPAAFGWTGATVIADVTARCRFGTTVVSSRTAYWFPSDGGAASVSFVTDFDTQTLRAPLSCLNSSLSQFGPNPPCDVVAVGVGPGGVPARR